MAVTNYLADIWFASEFRDPELADYAAPQIQKETRHGVQILALLSLLINLCTWFLVLRYADDAISTYSHIALAALSLHILISARFVHDIRALQGLGMVLLIVSALAIVFVAHRTGEVSIGMMAAIVMLFMSVPLVPWALREATLVIGLTIVLFAASVVSVPGRFQLEDLWLLELVVLGSIVIVSVLVARNTAVRKQDLRTRYELEIAHKAMELLSLIDPLTGAWNRRYLDAQFPKIAEMCRNQGKTLHVAVLDIDDFKGINDKFGHQFADGVLANLGRVFIGQVGDKGSVIRLGGDEFMILYSDDGLEDLIDSAVTEIRNDSTAKENVPDYEISLSAGFASAGPKENAQSDRLYMLADKALYSMKSGRHSHSSTGTGIDKLNRTGSWRL